MQKMRISKITLHDAASRKLYRTSVLLHLKNRESLALPFDYFIISNFNSYFPQNALAFISKFFCKHLHFALSSYSHTFILGDFGLIALLVGSYQYLQNAHFFMVFIFTVFKFSQLLYHNIILFMSAALLFPALLSLGVFASVTIYRGSSL